MGRGRTVTTNGGLEEGDSSPLMTLREEAEEGTADVVEQREQQRQAWSLRTAGHG